ncbi:hypothetical protein ICJ04_02500 [Stenotrophomonas sp. 169]|uniref:hypothetical protein n=1 Tax=Stenotrophomonas sp. 169 TaxID=2770322 RepID=UPI001662220A|nr:hypothetical protein [Stenotrophomonas sp. 169]QNR97809.1 hypothetical protein ICJ04_02500 [Stenotrophomonas sp. 169]
MQNYKSISIGFALVLLTGGLVACSSDNPETPIESAATDASAAPAADAPSEKTNPNLTADQVGVVVKVLGAPTYDEATDQLSVKVSVQNTGKVVLPVTGKNPVLLGIIQKKASGNGLPDTRGIDSRASFAADIAPGATAEVTAIVPAEMAVGSKLELEPLQENVVWFGFDLDQPTAVIGPFARCTDGKALCDADGKAIAAK